MQILSSDVIILRYRTEKNPYPQTTCFYPQNTFNETSCDKRRVTCHKPSKIACTIRTDWHIPRRKQRLPRIIPPVPKARRHGANGGAKAKRKNFHPFFHAPTVPYILRYNPTKAQNLSKTHPRPPHRNKHTADLKILRRVWAFPLFLPRGKAIRKAGSDTLRRRDRNTDGRRRFPPTDAKTEFPPRRKPIQRPCRKQAERKNTRFRSFHTTNAAEQVSK